MKRLTLQAVAAKAGLDLSQIARYEKGQGEPRATNLEALASALGVTTDYLLEPRSANELPYGRAAAEQSLMRFVRTADLDQSAVMALTRVANAHTEAPNTVEGWRALVEILRIAQTTEIARPAPVKVGTASTKMRMLQEVRSSRTSRRGAQ